MLTMTNKQMHEMCEHAADPEVEHDERRLCLEEQREDRQMQFQMQHPLMTTMIMMMKTHFTISRIVRITCSKAKIICAALLVVANI